MTGFRTEGADDLDRIAAALKEAGDKDLQKAISKSLRDVAKPIGAEVLAEGAEELPHRGGLASRVRDMGRVGVSSALRGRVASVQVVLKNKGADLKTIDKGLVRHPVFARAAMTRKEWTWVGQPVAPGAFSRAFEKRAEVARKAGLEAAQGVLSDVAGSV